MPESNPKYNYIWYIVALELYYSIVNVIWMADLIVLSQSDDISNITIFCIEKKVFLKIEPKITKTTLK